MFIHFLTFFLFSEGNQGFPLLFPCLFKVPSGVPAWCARRGDPPLWGQSGVMEWRRSAPAEQWPGHKSPAVSLSQSGTGKNITMEKQVKKPIWDPLGPNHHGKTWQSLYGNTLEQNFTFNHENWGSSGVRCFFNFWHLKRIFRMGGLSQF